MEDISRFLSKIKNIIDQDGDFKKNIYRIVKDHCRVELVNSDIRYQNGVIRLNLSPIKRQQLVMYKDKIIKELRLTYPKKTIKDIF